MKHRKSIKTIGSLRSVLIGIALVLILVISIQKIIAKGKVLSSNAQKVCGVYYLWENYNGIYKAEKGPFTREDQYLDGRACGDWLEANYPGWDSCRYSKYKKNPPNQFYRSNPSSIRGVMTDISNFVDDPLWSPGKNSPIPSEDIVNTEVCLNGSGISSYMENPSQIPPITRNPSLHNIVPPPIPSFLPSPPNICLTYKHFKDSPYFFGDEAQIQDKYLTKVGCKEYADFIASRPHCNSTTPNEFGHFPDTVIVLLTSGRRGYLPSNINMEKEFIGRYKCKP